VVVDPARCRLIWTLLLAGGYGLGQLRQRDGQVIHAPRQPEQLADVPVKLLELACQAGNS
jgi:hypothetical protein